MRAVVTEIRETSAAVLCEDGQIRLIPAQNFQKGQEITLSAGRRRIRRPLMWAACVAALCAMATTSVYAVCEPYSSVTVDGEESVEYTLNRFDWVIGFRRKAAEGRVRAALHARAGRRPAGGRAGVRERTGKRQHHGLLARQRQGRGPVRDAREARKRARERWGGASGAACPDRVARETGDM